MKITMVLASDKAGGLEKHVRELSTELVALGHTVTIIAPLVFLETVPDLVEKLPISASASRYNPLALWQLYRHLRQADGDLIHAQANKAAAMVANLKLFLNTPLVATLHNVKKQLNMFKPFAKVITVSAKIGQSLDVNVPATVIYNGIEPQSAQPIDLRQRYQLPSRQPVICAVGRLVTAKGFDVLLEAVDGHAVSLLIIGEGPARARLEQRISTLQAPTVVKLLGFSDEVAQLMASSDAVVIASRREGFSYVFVEALHSRCRLLSTNVPDINQILPPELIVPTESPLALREKLQGLLADLDGWAAQMAPAWTFAEESLTCRAMAQQTVAVYQDVLSG